MKKMIECRNWKEYNGLNGWVMFCSAGAYGKKLSAAEAKICGCTEAQRAKCKRVMESHVGFGLVPEVVEEVAVERKHRDQLPALLS